MGRALRGQGRRGFRENTRTEYRRLIAGYAHPYFPARLKLIDVSTYTLARFVDWLADEEAQGRRLADRTLANAVVPLRAALATAKREGLIRHNPAQGLALPPRDQAHQEEIRLFSPEQLATVVRLAPERHRLLLELLAATGLRISEAIALQRLHVQLDGSAPEVCVRRAIVRGRIEPPKTRSFPTRLAPRWTRPTSAPASSSRLSGTQERPGRAFTHSATPSPASTSAAVPTSCNSAAPLGTTQPRSRFPATRTCCRGDGALAVDSLRCQ